MARKSSTTATQAMTEAESQIVEEQIEKEASKTKAFDFTNYQISAAPQKKTVVIADTKDEFEVTVKELSWSRRNQILAESIKWNSEGNTAFNSDMYVRSCLKEILIDAPWGRTTEAFLISIDSRLGSALEVLVPKAFGDDSDSSVDDVKKEQAHS